MISNNKIKDYLDATKLFKLILKFGDVCNVQIEKSKIGFQKKNNEFLVLLYHRVNTSKDPFQIQTIHPDIFRKQVEFLKANFNVMPLSKLLTLQKNNELPKRSIAITFDDGYKDNYVHAYPILRDYDVPATIFLTAGCIEENEVLWFEKILELFRNTESGNLEIPEHHIDFKFKTAEEKTKCCFHLLEYMKTIPTGDIEELTNSVVHKLNARILKVDKELMLNWDEINEMGNFKVEFGSHTLTHPILSKASLDMKKKELQQSKLIIENRTQKQIDLFAYPNGKIEDYDSLTIKLLGEYGYKAAFTTVTGKCSNNAKNYELKRINPWGQKMSYFTSYLCQQYISWSN